GRRGRALRGALLCIVLGACATEAGEDRAACTTSWYRPGFSLGIHAQAPFPDGAYAWTIVRDDESVTVPIVVDHGWGQCTAPGCTEDASAPGLMIAIGAEDASVADWNGRDDDRPSASHVVVSVARGGWT